VTAKDGKRVGISLPEVNWEPLPGPGQGASESMSEPSFNDVESSSPAPVPSASASGDSQRGDSPVANSPVDGTTVPVPPQPSTDSKCKVGRRLVRKRARKTSRAHPRVATSVREHSAYPNTARLKTLRNTIVRIADVMGHELEEPTEQNDSEDSTEYKIVRNPNQPQAHSRPRIGILNRSAGWNAGHPLKHLLLTFQGPTVSVDGIGRIWGVVKIVIVIICSFCLERKFVKHDVVKGLVLWSAEPTDDTL